MFEFLALHSWNMHRNFSSNILPSMYWRNDGIIQLSLSWAKYLTLHPVKARFKYFFVYFREQQVVQIVTCNLWWWPCYLLLLKYDKIFDITGFELLLKPNTKSEAANMKKLNRDLLFIAYSLSSRAWILMNIVLLFHGIFFKLQFQELWTNLKGICFFLVLILQISIFWSTWLTLVALK